MASRCRSRMARRCAFASSASSATKCLNISTVSNSSTASPPWVWARAVTGKIAATTGTAAYRPHHTSPSECLSDLGHFFEQWLQFRMDRWRGFLDEPHQRQLVFLQPPILADPLGQPPRLDIVGTLCLAPAGVVPLVA